MADAKDFLFEIGTEEMPSAPLNNAVKQLGTVKPDLLIYRENSLYSRCLYTFIVENGECIGDGNSVITAESGSSCGNISVLNIDIESILGKIMGTSTLLLTYHV